MQNTSVQTPRPDRELTWANEADEDEEEADVFDSASPAFAGGYPCVRRWARLMLAGWRWVRRGHTAVLVSGHACSIDLLAI